MPHGEFFLKYFLMPRWLPGTRQISVFRERGAGDFQVRPVSVQVVSVHRFEANYVRCTSGHGAVFKSPDSGESVKLLQIQKCVARLPCERIQQVRSNLIEAVLIVKGFLSGK